MIRSLSRFRRFAGELLRISPVPASIGAMALALASCDAPRAHVDCVDAKTGFTLTDTGMAMPAEMAYGFSGQDTQGFTRTVSRQEAPRWKCKRVFR